MPVTRNQLRKFVPDYPTILYVCVTFLVPTILFAVLSSRFGFQGPVINADFLILAIICAIGGSRNKILFSTILIIGIFFIVLIHIAIGLGAIYIDDISLIREYFQFYRYWPWKEIFMWLALGTLFLLPLYLILIRIDFNRIRVMPITILLALYIAVDLFGDTSVGHKFIPENILTSSANRTISLAKKWWSSPGFSDSPINEPMMAGALTDRKAPLPDRILSVAVEAYGLANADALNQSIVQPMERLLSPYYSIRIATHPARGGTLTGEMRELCNLKTSGTPSGQDRERIGRDCLPHYLQARGYRTLGIHGNSGFFYSRRDLYPAIGFEETLFYDNFMRKDPSIPRCKTRAFDGICDRAAMAAALAFLQEGGPRFAHVMTLDTHFPLDAASPEDRKCDIVAGLRDEDLCIYAHRMRTVLTELAQQLAEAKNRPDRVYIYGDHPPPYVSKQERDYFDRAAVPFLVLTSRAP